MQADFANSLAQTLSIERLDAYRNRMPKPTSELELLGRYAWNMALSESLYPTLQLMEIALRNTIHHTASQYFGRDDWFDVPDVLKHDHERDAIRKAKLALSRQRKKTDSSRIVAELSFGFWTSLLDSRYEQTLWPRLLQSAFPHMPRRRRTRSELSKRFLTVRNLRNRVFHHEPIWHWQDLVLQHEQILEALAWINPAACDLAQVLDRFKSVHSAGTAPFEQALHMPKPDELP